MPDLSDFVLDFCRAFGGVAEPPVYGVHEVLLPDSVAARLGIEPFQRFAFDDGAGDEGVTRLAYGHPLVERMAELVREIPACSRFYVNDVRLDKSGLAALARAALSFPNANLGQAPRALETRMLFHYVRFNFKAALISDEKRESLVSVLMDAQTGAPAEEFSAVEAVRLSETPAFSGLPVAPAQWTDAPDPLAPEPLRALLDRAARAAADSLAGPAGGLQARAARLLELDRARLDSYYADLERDLERRLGRAEDDARRATVESKLAAVRADHAAKLADAEAKYRLRVELDPVNLAVIAQPKLALSVRVENRQAGVTRTVVYDPLRHCVEPMLCDVCARPAAKLLLCANGHLAGTDCLAPQCVDCKRVYCQTCAAEVAACAVCDRPVCHKSLIVCRECGRGTCREHVALCHAAAGQPARAAGEADARRGEAAASPETSSPPQMAPTPAPPSPSKPTPKSRPSPGKPKAPPPPATRHSSPDPGYRLDVQIERDEPLVTGFIIARGGREIAQRNWEMTDVGIAVTCICEKGWGCPATGVVLRPESPARIEAQLEAEIARLRAEYRIPAHRMAILTLLPAGVTRLPRLHLRGRWKDAATVEAARSASDSAEAPPAADGQARRYPPWLLALGPDERDRVMTRVERFVQLAYGRLIYEGALRASELAELTASASPPGTWYSPGLAAGLFRTDPRFRVVRGNVVTLDHVKHPLVVLREKEARGLPPLDLTADELLVAAAGPPPLTEREAEIERALNLHALKPLCVPNLQRMFQNREDPAGVNAVLVELCAPGDADEANHFRQLLSELWNGTPRFELRGRTPNEAREGAS